MIKTLLVETYKTRRRKMGWVIAALLAAQLLWTVWSASRMDAEDLKQGWLYIFYLFQLLDSLLMPVIVAVVASRLCDVEHKGQTFRLLNTLMSPGRLFDVKFLDGSVYLLVAALLQLVMMLAVGMFKGFEGNAPWQMFMAYFFLTTAVNLTLLALQQGLSLLFANQMVAFSVGLLGAFFGLFSLYFPPGLQNLAPWGYYGVLMFIHMDWDHVTRITHFYPVAVDGVGLAMLLVMFALIYGVGRILFVRKEY
jgi:lantibiotic transport system permease protein